MFGKDFLWGVATSAAQIEGGAAQDGRSPSIWDTFAKTSGKIACKKLFPTACDSYNNVARDVDNLKKLSVNSYRFSISWSRVIPGGVGALNDKGLDYYKRLIDALLSVDIKPNVTLYHWDLPQILQDKGGWVNRDSIDWFSEYAEKMFKVFKGVVPYWATINEPIATYVGYAKGKFAPGLKDEKLGNQARHNILVAHGQAVRAFRAVADKNAGIGIVIDVWKRYPKTLTQKNIDAAADGDERNWKFYTDPVYGKGYSRYILDALEKEGTLMNIGENDYDIMSSPTDFFGLNIYNRVVVDKDKKASFKLLTGGNVQEDNCKDYAQVLYDVCKLLKTEYNLKIPFIVTENGKASYVWEPKGFNGLINDNKRIEYMKNFLNRIDKANDDGLNVIGYYAWSLMDNIEWCAGPFMKFGLLKTDFKTYKTEWKKSAFFYRDFIREHTN